MMDWVYELERVNAQNKQRIMELESELLRLRKMVRGHATANEREDAALFERRPGRAAEREA